MAEGEKRTWRDRYNEARENMKHNKTVQWLQDNKVPILTGVGGASLAGITCLIMRGRASSQNISCGIPVAARGGIPVPGESSAIQNVVTGKNNVLNAVSYISADRQGPPSWVVRCKETGDVFTSQKSASTTMDLPAAEISRQLNGLIDHVRGYHFERLCMAA